MDMAALIRRIQQTPGCRVYPPNGLPVIGREHSFPTDMHDFYQVCGGVSLFEDAGYYVNIVPPQNLLLANPIIVKSESSTLIDGNDISWSWYIIAESHSSQYISIDLSPERLGRCYDSFWDIHPWNSTLIALSFSELLSRLLANQGQHWYWLQPGFEEIWI
jgi:hypothetical protein